MSPDLNSLPDLRPSPTLSTSSLVDRPRRTSFGHTAAVRQSPPSPRTPPLSSLQAAATINAGLQRTPSNASSARNGVERRRRFSLLNSFSTNDPAMPAPGELQRSNGSDGHNARPGRPSFGLPSDSSAHDRRMSLGELHQELENEQEAQVNRLLHMIRIQQDQLATLSREQHNSADHSSTSPIDDHNHSSTQSNGLLPEQLFPRPSSLSQPLPFSPHGQPQQPSPFSQHGQSQQPFPLPRRSSSRLSIGGASSRGTSPALRPVSGSLGPLTEDFMLAGTRDESAFYQAETQMLTRENQMLKHRIRDLERQIADMAVDSPQPSPAHSPSAHLAAVPPESSITHPAVVPLQSALTHLAATPTIQSKD